MMTMKKTRLILKTLLLGAALLFSACVDEEDKVSIQFNANIEQLDAGQNDGAKTHFVDERWIYWDEWDQISLASNASGSEFAEAWLLNHGSTDYSEFNGVFQTTMAAGSKYFVGLYPMDNDGHQVVAKGINSPYFSTLKIKLPSTQPYTNDTSFSKDVMPMVAWYGGEWADSPNTPFNLDFHSLGGIVRLQIFNITNTATTISSITITSKGRDEKQLCGLFDVEKYNTYDPYLTPKSVVDDADKTIEMTCGQELAANGLLSFYLVLPATKGVDASTTYQLKMTVTTNDSRTVTTNFTVPVRRNGITYMQALGLDFDDGASDVGIVGNGTKERPFKIYSIRDLRYIRSCFASSPVTINKQLVTEDTYFRIMNSNISLETEGDNLWNSGIQNFKGHLTYYATNSSTPCIVNKTKFPLIITNTAQGHIEGVTIKSDLTAPVYPSENFSPLCLTNNGEMKDCHIMSGAGESAYNMTSEDIGIGGICVENTATGTLDGCGCMATIRCPSRPVAGICLVNRGTVKGCFTTSSMSAPGASKVSGICGENYSTGTIRDCYFAARITESTADWAGIVLNNRGKVEHCYASSTAVITSSGSVAGIVGNNTAATGEINYCWSEASLRGRYVGMIATNVSDGKIINSFCNNPNMTMTLIAVAGTGEHYAGGLVAHLSGGSVVNSFVHMNHINQLDEKGYAGALVGKLSGGTIDNCYAYETYTPSRTFYGSVASGATYTISNSYIVIGSVAGESGITTVALDELETMQSGLNTNQPTGGKAWEGADDATSTPPHLETYTVSSGGKHRPRR